MFFFEKKNQKTFSTSRALPARRTPMVKSFLLLFFKKEDFLTSRPPAAAAPLPRGS
jgi:hypothetical protein